MFPHTHHKEMVLLFERTVDEEENPTIKTEAIATADAVFNPPNAGDFDPALVKMEEDELEVKSEDNIKGIEIVHQLKSEAME